MVEEVELARRRRLSTSLRQITDLDDEALTEIVGWAIDELDRHQELVLELVENELRRAEG